MLKSLQGKWHSVITGLTVIDSRNFKHVSGSEKTRVKFRKLSDDEITSYIKTGEPMDKAGSYGIQGKGALLAEKIEGCYFNVVGLPLARLSLMLKEFGIDLL
jgi:septum formation protein